MASNNKSRLSTNGLTIRKYTTEDKWINDKRDSFTMIWRLANKTSKIAHNILCIMWIAGNILAYVLFLSPVKNSRK